MKVIKKPFELQFSIATSFQTIDTLEGAVIARPGDAIITGIKGEQYPIDGNKFSMTYDILEPGICRKKQIIVEAIEMQEPFSVPVSWANQLITGKAGDFKLIYGPNNFGIVDRAIFFETYTILEQ